MVYCVYVSWQLATDCRGPSRVLAPGSGAMAGQAAQAAPVFLARTFTFFNSWNQGVSIIQFVDLKIKIHKKN